MILRISTFRQQSQTISNISLTYPKWSQKVPKTTPTHVQTKFPENKQIVQTMSETYPENVHLKGLELLLVRFLPKGPS